MNKKEALHLIENDPEKAAGMLIKLSRAEAKRDAFCVEAIRAGADKAKLKRISERLDKLYS